uniref:Uncharacterized protein n=1 Tax=Oryza glumipatula TaxID=40148 RepID=A0A0D9ZZT2_9ORYZ
MYMHPHNRTTPLHFPHPPNLGELHWRRRRLRPLPTDLEGVDDDDSTTAATLALLYSHAWRARPPRF